MRQRLGPAALLASLTAWAGCGPSQLLPEAQQGESIQSQHILERDLVTSKSEVRHVLIGWKDLAGIYGSGFDERAGQRSQQEARELALQLLRRARQGENFQALMKEFSEDSTTASTAKTYVVSLTAPLGPEFTKLGMRLYLGEIGLVKSPYGYHVIKRVQ